MLSDFLKEVKLLFITKPIERVINFQTTNRKTKCKQTLYENKLCKSLKSLASNQKLNCVIANDSIMSFKN